MFFRATASQIQERELLSLDASQNALRETRLVIAFPEAVQGEALQGTH
jgi:hypothetical protein